MMQDLEWIKDNLDYYEKLVAGIERLGPQSIGKGKVETVKADFEYIESECENLMSRFVQKLEVQRQNFFGRIVVHVLRNKIYMLEAYSRRMNELRERFNWAVMI
jgi:hypothetical protein